MIEAGTVTAPFIFDAHTAKIAEQTGFQAVYRTGHGTAALIGLPDTGLTTFSEMANHLGYVCEAVQVPVIADADTGYGGLLNVKRTVRAYEHAGAAALHLEDQVFPKKCGFFDGKQVIPLEEHVAKVKCALDVRDDPDFVIIARTDALTVTGWPDVLRRAEAYRAAGADLIFVDGISTIEDLDVYTRELVMQGIPCLYNGGLESAGAIAARGFKVHITGGGHALAFLAVRQALRNLRSGAAAPPASQELEAVQTLLTASTALSSGRGG